MKEEKVVELIKAQKDEGLELLKHCYSGLIHYIIRGILQSPNDIEECISDIFLKVWNSIDSFSPDKSKFTTWLTIISRNTAINYYKSKKKIYEELKDDFIDISSPEEAVLSRERAEELKKAIAALTYNERHIFYRKYYYMQRTGQIAAELGTTERSVEGKLYRIRKKLQNELGDDFR